MANHVSAEKRARQTIKRTERNKHVRSTIRTVVRKVREAFGANDLKTAETAYKIAIKAIDGAVSKGVYPRNAGSRYISRLSAQLDALKLKK